MKTVRRISPFTSILTLVAFWSSTLQVSPVIAQSAGGSVTAHLPMSDASGSAEGVYDGETQSALTDHFTEADALSSEELPGLTDDPAALAALPSGPGSVSPQATALPSGAATQMGMGESFTALLSTGGSSYSVPLTLPTARGAAQPQLSLTYSSSAGSGVAGVGWSIGAAAISRQTDRGIPKYDDRADWHPEQDRFSFGGTELVPICTVTTSGCTGKLDDEVMPVWAAGWQYFRARIEGAFLRFFWSPNHRTWRVQSQDGVSLELGVPLDGTDYRGALQMDPDAEERIFSWHLVRQYDTQGSVNTTAPTPLNVVVYRYIEDNQALYLSDIYDTSPAGAPTTTELHRFAHHTRLIYEARPDPALSYRAGYLIEAGLRLARVDIASKPYEGSDLDAREVVRRYHLSYDPYLHRSVLVGFQLEGRCASPATEGAGEGLPLTSCPRLRPLSFEYQRPLSSAAPLYDAQGFAFDPVNEVVRSLHASPPHSLDEAHTELADVNADGLTDVLVTAGGIYDGEHGVYWGTQTEAGEPGFSALDTIEVEPAGDALDANVLSLDNPRVSTFDLDGDGIINLVHMARSNRYTVHSPVEDPSRPGKYVWQGRAVGTASREDVKIDFDGSSADIRVMDVNSDGLVDVVYSSPTEIQTFFALGRYPGGNDQFGDATWTSATTAELSNDPVAACAPWSSTPARFSDPDVQLGDMNGDGLADIVRVRSGQILYWPGRGNGHWGTGDADLSACPGGEMAVDEHIDMWRAPTFGVARPGTLLINDVNADGLSDLIEIRSQGADIYLNDGGYGWTERHTIDETPFLPAASNYVRLADINGSGSADLVWGHAHEYKYIDLTGGQTPHLLTRVSNGLGKTLELEYEPSTGQMMRAERSNDPWEDKAPVVVPLLVRTTVRDNLQAIGWPAGAYVSNYVYRDPVYDGRQREFRGFREAVVEVVGDQKNPTSYERSVFLLGECPDDYEGTSDVCSPLERWQDNWREALKGLPVLSEVYSAQAVYLSTDHSSYTLKQLYSGRDGRRVVFPQKTTEQSYRYNTYSFDHADQEIVLDDVVLDLLDVHGGPISGTEQRYETIKASAGTARIVGGAEYDDFGHVILRTSEGCRSGCPSGGDDEITSRVATFALPPADASGWLWRQYDSHVVGEPTLHSAARQQLHYTYDSRGQLLETRATLSGTLPLDRSHAAGGAVAPVPPEASVDSSTGGDILIVSKSYDQYGHADFVREANQRCSNAEFDDLYEQLPKIGRSFVGPLAGQCGSRPLVHEVTYDRGLEAVQTSISPTGQRSSFVYDGLGRLKEATGPNPALPGQPAAHAKIKLEYILPDDSSSTPYSIVIGHIQDGVDANASSYRESWTFIDGLDRPIIELRPADPAAGDGGNWIVSGAVRFDAKGESWAAYDPWFYSGLPQNIVGVPFESWLAGPFGSRERDAFGRVIWTYDAGVPRSNTRFYALSRDSFDAEDLVEGGRHVDTPTTVIMNGHGDGVERIDRIRVNGNPEERRVINERLPTGELERVTLRRTGSPDVVRWMRYDSLGRMVLNAEPNTSVGFQPNPAAPIGAMRAWRYAYNDSGDVVGVSDARGCGANYFYDSGGRLLAEDRSPCEATQPAYTTPNLVTGDGTEVFYRYDLADPDGASVVDAAGTTLPIDSAQLWGRIASVSSLGSKAILRYDVFGRRTGSALRVQRPGVPSSSLATRYAPRWYLTTVTLDAADRPLSSTTGMTVPELLGNDGQSKLTYEYTERGGLKSVAGSYGVLLASSKHRADGRFTEYVLGDAAATRRSLDYDIHRRLWSAKTERSGIPMWTAMPPGSSYTPPTPGVDDPTVQIKLEDGEISYDEVGNVIGIADFRSPNAWPASAKPVQRTFQYDDLYRLEQVDYAYLDGNAWASPFAAEHADATRVQPAPRTSFATRVLQQTYTYDWLGNISRSRDDSDAFYDRSSGDRAHGTSTLGPNRVTSASNRTLAASSPRKGDSSIGYDAAGNVTGVVVRRDGPCLPAAASCWQRFAYEWNEVGDLVRARRWDLRTTPTNERTANDALTEPLPARAADVELVYRYDAGSRILKTAIDPAGNQRHTVYVSQAYELRSTTWNGTDYVLSAATASLRVGAGPIAARVIYAPQDLPSLSIGHRHVFLELSDHLGSGSIVIDQETGELVELATYEPYGATESDYRPGRWANFREPYKFTGKEEDIEVGLQYFGARYYSPNMGVWLSPDPVTIHDLGSDMNPYSYVRGQAMNAIDPDGREILTAILIGAAIGAVVAGAANATAQAINGQKFDWGSFFVAVGVGAVAGAISGGYMSGIESAGYNFSSTIGALGTSTKASIVGELIGVTQLAVLGASTGAVAGAAIAHEPGRPFSALATLKGAGAGAARGAEAGLLAGVGAMLSGAFSTSFNVPLTKQAAAMSGGLNGAIKGSLGTYDWGGKVWDKHGNTNGFLAFFADNSPIGMFSTYMGNLWMGVQLVSVPWGGHINTDLSHRSNVVVWEDAVTIRGKGATTMGSTISHSKSFQTDLIDHEKFHAATSRFGFGFYELSYGAMFAVGAVVGVAWWAEDCLGSKCDRDFGDAFSQAAYYNNLWERWAYYHHGGNDKRPEPALSTYGKARP